jgi:hypothetical protein
VLNCEANVYRIALWADLEFLVHAWLFLASRRLQLGAFWPYLRRQGPRKWNLPSLRCALLHHGAALCLPRCLRVEHSCVSAFALPAAIDGIDPVQQRPREGEMEVQNPGMTRWGPSSEGPAVRGAWGLRPRPFRVRRLCRAPYQPPPGRETHERGHAMSSTNTESSTCRFTAAHLQELGAAGQPGQQPPGGRCVLCAARHRREWE